MPRKPWFAPKRYGYGAGLPISWEGWLVVGLYVAAVTAAPLLLSSVAGLVFITLVSAVVIVICARRTDGGWRWRNGD